MRASRYSLQVALLHLIRRRRGVGYVEAFLAASGLGLDQESAQRIRRVRLIAELRELDGPG